MMRTRLLLLAVVACVCAHTNMNGDYLIANPMSPSSYDADLSQGGKSEYFDVYAPTLSTRYSEVFWINTGSIPLPQHIVERFANKTIAITGYEFDQVFRHEDGDKSVPITWVYNHHYLMYLTGAGTTLVAKDPSSEPNMDGHEQLVQVDSVKHHHTSRGIAVPTAQYFAEANGGEARKSYHGHPKGYAQLLYHPQYFSITPMMIDTRNRDYNGTDFRPGPLPKAAKAPPHATYSGLLECPCTDRITKIIRQLYTTRSSGTCDESKQITTSSECFVAATQIGLSNKTTVVNATVNSSSVPCGCSLVTTSPGHVTAKFNTLCESVPTTKSAQCGAGGSGTTHGSAHSLVALELLVDSKKDVVTITMTGPSNVWFGVGFNATAMAAMPYTIVVLGNGTVQERKLGNHLAGTELAASVTVVSNTVAGGLRTVVLTRGLEGKTSEYMSFSASTDTIKFINAVGNSADFGFHKDKAATEISLLHVNGATCVCGNGVKRALQYMDQGAVDFDKDCRPEPLSDLLQQHNPTCTIEGYQGGQNCCRHGTMLLDRDQEVPEDKMEYNLKFRFYFQEYDEATNYPQDLIRMYYQTEAWAKEYDIPKAPAGTPPADRVHTITSRFKLSDIHFMCGLSGGISCDHPTGEYAGIQLMRAAAHCHAPSCISMELYNADTGLLICRQDAIMGTGNTAKDKFDELGYATVPPCMWGDPDEGLLPPIFLPKDTNLLSIKRNNNTNAHTGEMASWCMRGMAINVTSPAVAVSASPTPSTMPVEDSEWKSMCLWVLVGGSGVGMLVGAAAMWCVMRSGRNDKNRSVKLSMLEGQIA